jgi:hypothetical protein
VRRALLLGALLLAAGCTPSMQEVLPISQGVVGAATVANVDVVVRPSAAAAVAALDAQALARPASEDELRRLPVAQLIQRQVMEVARQYGLAGGRRLRVVAEIDAVGVPGTAASLIGADDRLAGTAFIHDAARGDLLGQLYIDVRRDNSGFIGLALRGGGVRERLAAQFAEHLARALSGRTAPLAGRSR